MKASFATAPKARRVAGIGETYGRNGAVVGRSTHALHWSPSTASAEGSTKTPWSNSSTTCSCATGLSPRRAR